MIIDKAILKQRELGMLDFQFAEHIGVSQAHWSELKNRKAKPGLTFLRGLATSCPDLKDDCLLFLAGNIADNEDSAATAIPSTEGA